MENEYFSLAVIGLIACGIFIQNIPEANTNRISSYVQSRPIMAQAAIFGVGLMLLSALSGNVSAFLLRILLGDLNDFHRAQR